MTDKQLRLLCLVAEYVKRMQLDQGNSPDDLQKALDEFVKENGSHL